MRAGNPNFYAILDECANLHETKNIDYAGSPDEQRWLGMDNFMLAAADAGVTPETVFRVILGIKRARLASLLRAAEAGREPNHESVRDTQLDIINYTALMEACRASFPDQFTLVPDLQAAFVGRLTPPKDGAKL